MILRNDFFFLQNSLVEVWTPEKLGRGERNNVYIDPNVEEH